MPDTKDKQPKVLIPFRHSPCIKTFILNRSADENSSESQVARNIFNAGLKSMYGLEIRDNEIVTS